MSCLFLCDTLCVEVPGVRVNIRVSGITSCTCPVLGKKWNEGSAAAVPSDVRARDGMIQESGDIKSWLSIIQHWNHEVTISYDSHIHVPLWIIKREKRAFAYWKSWGPYLSFPFMMQSLFSALLPDVYKADIQVRPVWLLLRFIGNGPVVNCGFSVVQV